MNTLTLNPIEQTQASSLVKPTYGFISTAEILQTFKDKGWTQVSTSIAKTRSEARQGYQKHLIRLEHPNFKTIEGLNNNNSSRPQLCLLNSHDGSAALRLFYGVLRIACLNGIIAGSVLKDFRLVHSQSAIKNLSLGIEDMTNNIGQVIQQVQCLASKTYSPAAQIELIKGIVDLRLANVNNIVDINYESALKVRRMEDAGTDAYTIFNRLQESIIRGGIQYTYNKEVKDQDGQVLDVKQITTTTKRLSSVTSQLNLNRAAYDLAIKLVA